MALFGKYRGIVIDIDDPQQLGQIKVVVPSLFDQQPLAWAMPCLPAAEAKSGSITLPDVGAQVWIEFEAGDPNLPIWAGVFV